MCYSAMVYASLKKTSLRFKARIDYALFDDLFDRRVKGEKVRLSKGLEFNFQEPENSVEARIKKNIDKYKEITLSEKERELFLLKKRLADANRKLLEKSTKTAEKERGIAERKIERTKNTIQRLKAIQPLESENRIYSLDWAPVLIWKNNERVIVPMRYHLRPPGVPEEFDRKYPGCYNARRDSLMGFWRKEFGKKHAVFIISSFFENVKKHDLEKRALASHEKEENIVLEFKPKGLDHILVPCIWDQWEKKNKPSLTSFALITDEPPTEVADTGHDRCPIFLKESNINHWLQPEGISDQKLFEILDDRERPFYEHAIAV